MEDYTRLQAVIASRLNMSIADLLLAVADHFYCRALQIPPAIPPIDGMADLLILLEARYADEWLTQRSDVRALGGPDEKTIPDWLRQVAEGSRLDERSRSVLSRWP
jgi:hypothetical protein